MPDNNNFLINLSFLLDRPTGISVYAQNIFPYLKKLQPILLSAQSYSGYKHYVIPDNLTPKQGARGHLSRLWWTQFSLPRIYQQLAGNLLFSPVPEIPLYSPCRSIVMVHDLIPLRFPRLTSPLTTYFRYYLPHLLPQAEHIICNSVATARDIQHFFKIPAARITPILLAHDATHFRPLPTNSPSVPPYFLYLGRHDPYKNLRRLLAAFAAMKNSPDYQLWLTGSYDRRYTPQLRLQAEELGIASQVKFLDYVTYQQLPEIINGALAVVFPSLWEGFGFPVLEAMACGTPVITSNLASLPEVAGEAAILVNPYRIEEISSALEQIAADAQLRSHLSMLGKQRASQFSWQKTGQATVQVLTQYL